MIIKTSKFREDMFEEVKLYSNVIELRRTYDLKDESKNLLDHLVYRTDYEQDKLNGLVVDEYDRICILNDNGENIYTFYPLNGNKNSDGSLRTTSTSEDESKEVKTKAL